MRWRWFGPFILAGFLVSPNARPNSNSQECADSLQAQSLHPLRIPLPYGFRRPHSQGIFGAERKHDIHTGIDLYCNPGDPVVAMESGRIVAIEVFTGPHANPPTPWWQDTYAVLVEGASGVLVYGEIEPDSNRVVGDMVLPGQMLGKVQTVVTKNKGLPTTMLHLERLAPGSRTVAPVWHRGKPRPAELLDPTELIIPFLDDVRVKEMDLRQSGLKAFPHLTHSAVVRIRDQRGRILLLRRSNNDPTYPGTWGLPGGKLDPWEIPIEAAVREAFEESGLNVRIRNLIRIERSDLVHRMRTYVIHCFEAEIIGSNRVKLSHEHSQFAWVSPEQARKLQLSGLLTYQLVFGP